MQSICPKSFYQPNFRPVDYTDTKGESRPAYLLTRDAFTLLAMGFTGTAAVRWKLHYLEAFNEMENRLSVSQAELQRCRVLMWNEIQLVAEVRWRFIDEDHALNLVMQLNKVTRKLVVQDAKPKNSGLSAHFADA